MAVRGLRVEGSRVVHRPATMASHRGELLPVPGCHAGITGWDPRRLRASEAPINCRRSGCRTDAASSLLTQLPLFVAADVVRG